MPEWTQFGQESQRKRQKTMLQWPKKLWWKTCFITLTHLHFLPSFSTILKAIPKRFPTEMKPSKGPAEGKKKQDKKSKKKGVGKVKGKSQDCCVTFQPKNYLKIVLSVHAPTSESCYFASGIEGCKLFDIAVAVNNISAFWGLYSQTLIGKWLDSLQKAFFGKVPRGKWDKFDFSMERFFFFSYLCAVLTIAFSFFNRIKFELWNQVKLQLALRWAR